MIPTPDAVKISFDLLSPHKKWMQEVLSAVQIELLTRVVEASADIGLATGRRQGLEQAQAILLGAASPRIAAE